MKKICFFLSAVAMAFTAGAQTVPNGDMELWHTSSAGGGLGGAAHTLYAPNAWYGFDSTIITDGELFGSFIGAGSDWKAQLFQENTIVNGGSSSAKVMTLKQDTMGYVGGILSNAKLDLDVSALLGGGLTDPLAALTFSGGTPTTLRITTVSAYVELLGGIDTTTHTMGGADTGMLVVQAICTAYGADSVIGMGFVPILPSASFTQITANVLYTDTVSMCNMVRIIFSSGSIFSLGGSVLDSTTLYVDDVTMAGVTQTPPPPPPNQVKNVAGSETVHVYPNPAKGSLYFDGPQNAGFTARLISVSGQVAASQQFAGNGVIGIENLPAGIYAYTITDKAGKVVQRGKTSIEK